jgi:UDP-N-acetylglucosamine 2-epimerase (non-hydrolysing)
VNEEIPKLICVVGARPNFVKIGPLLQALSKSSQPVQTILVHTGQHYDAALDTDFFTSLQLPTPEHHLGVGSASHSVQTAQIMLKFEPILESVQPTAVLVVGDVNSTIACSLVAAKHQVPVVHVEAGLRSHDRAMPEEINRILTDHLSSLLFTTEPSGNNNLMKEGIESNKVHFVGNIMIDTLIHFIEMALPPEQTFHKYDINLQAYSPYALVTLHRPSNVDDKSNMEKYIASFRELNTVLPILFPLHPRTEKKLQEFGLLSELKEVVITCPPLNYLEMLGCMKNAKVVLTDSGGIQEETTMLQVPCITLRENTERPVTISEGTNRLIGQQLNKLSYVVRTAIEAAVPKHFPLHWDGKTSGRISDILIPWLYQTNKMHSK